MDPREIITPDAFTVAPELLGTPLARPRRRAAAMLLDLLMVGVLIALTRSVLLPLLAGVLFLRAARQTNHGGVARRGGAQLLRAFAVVLIVAFALRTYSSFSDYLSTDEDEEELAAPERIEVDPDIDWGARDVRVLPIVERFLSADHEAEAQREAAALAGVVREHSQDPAEQKRLAEFVLAAVPAAEHRPALEQALAPFVTAAPLDTAEVARLNRTIAAYRTQNAELRTRLAQARERRGLRRIVAGFADDLGVGFGWLALYFTTSLVLLKGQTPGKRFLGLRVIRLDGKPLSWWLSFERFGGYAASFSTGLLGFAQILWDRNRQGLHDKAAGTVVIQLPLTTADGAPLPFRFAPRPPPSAP